MFKPLRPLLPLLALAAVGTPTLAMADECTEAVEFEMNLFLAEGEWAVEVTPEGYRSYTLETEDGELDLIVTNGPGHTALSFDLISPPDTEETPIVPDIIIRPRKPCPPPT